MATQNGRIVFFMLPEQFFELLEKFVVENKPLLLFRRPETSNFESGYYLVTQHSKLEELYRDGEFRVIYLSLNSAPHHSQDWEFTSRCNEEVIDIRLGDTAPGQIESSEARLYIPGGPAQPMLDALRRKIASVCHRGIRGIRHNYPDMYWSEEVRSMALYRALGKEASRFWPMED
ncbi:MAG: hypothetical protein Tsb0020_29240 [Haliangiales bacterium]